MYRSTYYQTYFNAHYLEAAAEKGKYVKEAGEAVGGGSLHWKPARRERDFQFQRGKSSFELSKFQKMLNVTMKVVTEALRAIRNSVANAQ